MTITIAGTNFEQHHYDQRGDVLYLSVVDYKGPPATAFSTPEGHNIEYDQSGTVIGMTLLDYHWQSDFAAGLCVGIITRSAVTLPQLATVSRAVDRRLLRTP